MGTGSTASKVQRFSPLTVTATSQAARADVPPIMVKAHMNQKLSDGTKPMLGFAVVTQKYKP